jgi:microcystin-dependent protein
MKKNLFCISALLISSHFYSQVGVNTPTPTKMLDINGNLRVRKVPDVTTQTVSNLLADATGIISVSAVPISASGYTVGDIKKGFQPKDHNGWYLLDGRAINLLLGGQAGAASLGLTALPDARGRFLKTKAATETLGSVGGSNNRTLTQANLPAYNYTGSTNASGDHTHPFTELGVIGGGDIQILAGPNPTFKYTTIGRTTNPAGNHNHTATVANEGGGGSFSILPKNITVNTFIFLGN